MSKMGFTLIELMLVVVIIGVLAAIAIPKYTNIQDQALECSCRSNLRSLGTAEELYYNQFKTYGSVDNLVNCEIVQNANIMQCPTVEIGYTVSHAVNTYSIPCPSLDPNHGNIEDGVPSW